MAAGVHKEVLSDEVLLSAVHDLEALAVIGEVSRLLVK